MLIKDIVTIDGVRKIRTRSTVGSVSTEPRGDGFRLAFALDAEGDEREYYETGLPIDEGQVSEDDKDAALRRFGVEV